MEKKNLIYSLYSNLGPTVKWVKMSINLNISKSKIKAAYKRGFPHIYTYILEVATPTSFQSAAEEVLCPCGNETLYNQLLYQTKWEERGDVSRARPGSKNTAFFHSFSMRAPCVPAAAVFATAGVQSLHKSLDQTFWSQGCCHTPQRSDVNLTISCTRE